MDQSLKSCFQLTDRERELCEQAARRHLEKLDALLEEMRPAMVEALTAFQERMRADFERDAPRYYEQMQAALRGANPITWQGGLRGY